MDIRMIVALIRRARLEDVERALRQMNVEDISVSKVKGYGEYQNFFSEDWMVEEVRIEILTRPDEVESIVGAIMQAGHTGMPGDGVVAVMPVEKLYLVRTRAEATLGEFGDVDGSRQRMP